MDNCVFCGIKKAINEDRIIYEDDNWIAILDNYPVSDGHTILISKQHYETYFNLPPYIQKDMYIIIQKIRCELQERYNPDGWNIGCNCGEAAGQTVMHFHMHIIPRYKGDCENPRGGVRGVVPSKQSY
jgi:diadenosine tetraphosphate (Ap4A) HIT family hydrolase